MVTEFIGVPCKNCGGTHFAVYTVRRDSEITGRVYEARQVCRDCGQVVRYTKDRVESRAVKALVETGR